jgi:putative transposase
MSLQVASSTVSPSRHQGARERGYDPAKKVIGRKRHIAVKTNGRLLMVNMTTADIADSAGAMKVLEAVHQRWSWMKHLVADSAYDRAMLMGKALMLKFVGSWCARCRTSTSSCQ